MINRQQIRPSCNVALQKLIKINPFYSNITTNNKREDFSEQSDTMLWKLLTDKNIVKDAREANKSDETYSDDDIEGNDKFKERELNESSPPFPTVMYNVDGPNIYHIDIVNIASAEGQIPVSFISEASLGSTRIP